MVEEAPASPRLFRWGGMAIVVAGVLMVVATLLHPSRETTATIIASEPRLVAAHALYTLAWLLILLGLPGLYSAQREGMGRLGLTGFLFAWRSRQGCTGRWRRSRPENPRPRTGARNPKYPVTAIRYVPNINGLAAIAFMVGYALFGIAMIRTATLPRWSGMLVAVGGPVHLIGFGISQLVSTAAWVVAVLGAASLGLGLGWPGYRLWRTPSVSDRLPVQKRVRR
jgi:hypothetical protein